MRDTLPGTRPGADADAVCGVVPSFVARPKSTAEASGLTRLAAEHGLAVVVSGEGTKMHWGRPPDRCDLLIETLDLGPAIEHSPGDLVVKVGAGASLESVQAELREAGQRLAIDDPAGGGTIGGLLATGLRGPSALLYGAPRDLLIGVTIVRADGVAAKAGGRVVKNVAGYDLGKLFTGSFGTLGLIAEATFRLHPLPRTSAYVTTTAENADGARDRVRALADSPLVFSAVEVNRAPGGTFTVAALLEGFDVAARVRAARDLLGPDTDVSETPPGWWNTLPAGGTLIRVSTKPSELAALTSELDPETTLRGSAASGLWWIGVPGEEPSGLLGRLRGQGWSAVVHDAPNPVADPWGPIPALALMRRIKDQFDPEHRLSPGRFPGGI